MWEGTLGALICEQSEANAQRHGTTCPYVDLKRAARFHSCALVGAVK